MNKRRCHHFWRFFFVYQLLLSTQLFNLQLTLFGCTGNTRTLQERMRRYYLRSWLKIFFLKKRWHLVSSFHIIETKCCESGTNSILNWERRCSAVSKFFFFLKRLVTQRSRAQFFFAILKKTQYWVPSKSVLALQCNF